MYTNNDNYNVIFDSLLYVSLTRAKENMYVFYENMFDDIGKKI